MILSRKKTPPPSKGIVLSHDFQVLPRHAGSKSTLLMVLIQALIILLGLIGAGYSYLTMFTTPHSVPVLMTFLFVCTVIWMLVFYQERAQLALKTILLLIPIPLAMLFWRDLKEGFIVTSNHVIYSINRQQNWKLNDYIVKCEPEEFSYVATVFFLFVSFYLSFLLCWAVVNRHSFLIAVLSTLPLLFGFIFALVPSYVPILMLITCWMALFSMYPLKIRRKKRDKTQAFTTLDNKTKSSYVLSDPKLINRVMMKSGAVIITTTLLCIALLLVSFPKAGYSRSDRINQLHANLLQGMLNINATGSTTGIGGLSDGDLSKLGNLSFQHIPVIRVSTNYSGPMYLRGWVGSEYTGSKWINSDSSSGEFQNKVAAETFPIPQYQTANFIYLNRNNLKGSYSYWDGEIEYLNAKKQYFYTPYGIQSLDVNSDQLRVLNDLEFRPAASFSQDSYRFTFLTPQENGFYQSYESEYQGSYGYFDQIITDSQTKRDYATDEEAYRSYVYWEYTYLTDSTREFALRFLEENGLPNTAVPNEYNSLVIQKIVSEITEFLHNQYEYTLSPGPTPEGEDFVEHFLSTSKQGYCSHYASSSVILLRALGIPARYAEGYVVTESDIKNSASGDGLHFEYTIKDTNAHAWVEIYQNGAGWIPFETTPGYSQLQEINLTGENIGGGGDGGRVSQEPYPEPIPINSSSFSSVDSSPSSDLHSPSSLPSESEPSLASVPTELKLFLIVTSSLLFTLALTIAILLLRRKMILHSRDKKFHSTNISLNAYRMFEHFLMVLEYEGLPNREISLLKHIEKVACKYPFIDEKEITELTYIALKTQYSNETISKEEWYRMEQFTSHTIQLLYQSHSFWERLIFKYIHNLC